MKLAKYRKAGMRGDLLALLAGIFLTLAFAPFNLIPLAVVAPLMLLALWSSLDKKQAFYRGWLFGLGNFGTGVYWVFISIHTYGQTSTLVAAIITFGFINILAFFPAISGYYLAKYFPKNNDAKILFAFPALFIFFEWLRGLLFTGFPWLAIGYTQVYSPLGNYAAYGSVYLVGLLVLISAGLIYMCVKYYFNPHGKILVRRYLLVLLCIWSGGVMLNFLTWTLTLGKPVQVSLVQGNIPQQLKWVPEHLQPTLDTYVSLSKKHWHSDIVIWPEGAIPESLQDAKDFVVDMSDLAARHHAGFITGIPVQSDSGGYYNAVIAVGNGKGFYLKNRLVPFGEYIPFEKQVAKLFDLLHIPMSDFISGDQKEPPLLAGGVKFATFICYEIAFPELVRMRDPSIGALLTVSNDAWFGHSIAQAQHLQIAQMRAMELQRPLLFVSNDGITAIVNAHGRIQERIPSFTAGVLTGKMQPRSGLTPWQLLGGDSFVIPLILLFLWAFLHRKQA
jgi:apolipoprotein N-acyltransferase